MASIEQVKAGQYEISGVLDFSTVSALLTQIHGLQLEPIATLDFSRLENANSAGLALLLELLADARKQNRKLIFSGLPDSLLDLAKMSNVKHLLVSDS